MVNNTESVTINRLWLESLMQKAKLAESELNALPVEFFTKTKNLNILVGFCSSAENIIKTRRR